MLQYDFKAEDVIKAGRITRKDINKMREWTEKQRDVPNLTDEQIANFLLSCDNNLEFTEKTITGYYKARSTAPELFSGRDVDSHELKAQMATSYYIVFPEKTNDGCAIIYHKICDSRHYKYNLSTSLKLIFMTLDAALYRYPPTGLIIVIDLKEIGIMHLTRIRPHLIAVFCQYLQEGLPVQLRAIHVLNCVWFMDKLMALIQPFMSKHLYELINFHSSNVNMETFYKEYIPKRCLPAEYGGDLSKTEKLQAQCINLLSEMKPFFDIEEKQRTDLI